MNTFTYSQCKLGFIDEEGKWVEIPGVQCVDMRLEWQPTIEWAPSTPTESDDPSVIEGEVVRSEEVTSALEAQS